MNVWTKFSNMSCVLTKNNKLNKINGLHIMWTSLDMCGFNMLKKTGRTCDTSTSNIVCVHTDKLSSKDFPNSLILFPKEAYNTHIKVDKSKNNLT